MTIEGLLNKVKSVDARKAVPDIVQQTSYEIEALNKTQLFNYGVSSDGLKLVPSYSSIAYAREKNYANPRPGFGVPDLFITGSFFKDFYVKTTKNTFQVDSVNSKSSKLKEKYGDQIFGLTKDNIKVYATGVFYAEFKKYITLKTGLIFR